MDLRCGRCTLAAPGVVLPRHLHYSVLEGIIITYHWSDGTKTQATIWGAAIIGRVI
jgi:hypothetical protein